jgi:hypothetical protein
METGNKHLIGPAPLIQVKMATDGFLEICLVDCSAPAVRLAAPESVFSRQQAAC